MPCRSSSRIRRSTSRKRAKLHFEYLEEMRHFLQWRSRDAILLGEANVLPQDTMRYFGDDGDGIHMMFNFFVNQHLFYALASERRRAARRGAARDREAFPTTAQWAQFLRNHDELDLGRLTEKQRAGVFAALRSRPRRCSCTTAASAAGWRRCSAIAATSSWPTA